MTVIPYEPAHLERIQVRDVYAHGECPKTIMTSAFTFIDEGQVVAIFGGFPFIPGVIHFWGLTSDLVKRKPCAFHRKCLEVLQWYIDQEKPRRLQIDVRDGYCDGQRWAEALGFEREGRMSGWAPDGAAHFLYGRVA